MEWVRREVIVGEELYPPLLREVGRCPKRLYLLGSEENVGRFAEFFPDRFLAIVGSRKMSDYGRIVTSRIAAGVVGSGVAIVSGLMYGVDEVAQRAAVDAGGFSVGVWGGGIESLLAGGRADIAQRVLGRGVILSEYAFDVAPVAWMFPARNRIVAGMCRGVLVTEAAMGSGSLITAGFAADYGREVMAVPGSVLSQMSQGTNYLISQGAKLVLGSVDVMEVMGWTQSRGNNSSPGSSEDESLGKVIEELERVGSIMADDLVAVLGWEVGRVMEALTALELGGKVVRRGGRFYLAGTGKSVHEVD